MQEMSQPTETQLALLNREVGSHTKIMETLTIAVQEMGKVTNSIERMLVVHEQRLANSDREILNVKHEMEKHQMEMQTEISNLYEHIDKKNGRLAEMITSSETRISQSISTLSQSIETRDNRNETRIAGLEKKQYIILGGGIVIGILLNFFSANFSVFLPLFSR
jgi:hypothetical protein